MGQYFFDYSRTKIITRIKVTVDANLARKHYENHQWEDQSKHASHFIYYSFYKIIANVASPYALQHQKTRPTCVTFGFVGNNANIVSTCNHVWNSCAEPAIHNLDFTLVKDCDLFMDAKVDFKHCGNADEIDSSGRPFPYWTTSFEVDYVEF